MKTNTAKTLVALLSSALVLSSSVFAGPGPQVHSQSTGAVQQKTAAKTTAVEKQFPRNLKAVNETSRKPVTVSTAHGSITVLL